MTEEPIVKRYKTGNIRPGPNSREEFDPEELEELGQSMLETKGPLQPLVGVPDEDGVGIELIAGERRWRAAQLKGIEELPVMHRERPSEKDWLKWNLIENLQRVNLKPLEQARSVVRMLELKDEEGRQVYTEASLAEELGKAERFIATCAAFMKASDKLKDEVNAGHVALEIGAMIGALPQSLHESAEAEIVFRPSPLGPMNRIQARAYIATLRRDLRKASFDLEDGTLVEGATACSACPYWGGNRADVTGRWKDKVCLNPACFESKQRAAAEVVRRHAEEQNTRVLPEPESRRIFQTWDDELTPDSGYVELSRRPAPWMLKEKEAADVPEWSDIIGESGAAVIIAFDAHGQQRRLVETKVALTAAKQSEKHAASFKDEAADKVQTAEERKRESAIKKAGDRAARLALLEGGAQFVERLAGPWPEAHQLQILRVLFSLVQSRCMQRDDAELMCRMLQPDLERIASPLDTLEELLSREVLPGRMLALVCMAVMVRAIRFDDRFDRGAASDETRLAQLAEFDHLRWDKDIDARRKAAEKAVKDGGKKKGKGGAPKKGKKGKGAPPAPEGALSDPGQEQFEMNLDETPEGQSSGESGDESPDVDMMGYGSSLLEDMRREADEEAAKNPPEMKSRQCAHCGFEIIHMFDREFDEHLAECSKAQPLKRPVLDGDPLVEEIDVSAPVGVQDDGQLVSAEVAADELAGAFTGGAALRTKKLKPVKPAAKKAASKPAKAPPKPVVKPSPKSKPQPAKAAKKVAAKPKPKPAAKKTVKKGKK